MNFRGVAEMEDDDEEKHYKPKQIWSAKTETETKQNKK